jgi:hypothetical protein
MWCFFSRKEDIWVLQKEEEEEDSRDPCVQQINYRHCNGAVERFIWLFGVCKLDVWIVKTSTSLDFLISIKQQKI